MNALELTREDEVDLAMLSLVCAVGGVFVGLRIASTVPFFLELEEEARKNVLIQHHLLDVLLDVLSCFFHLYLYLVVWQNCRRGLFAPLGVYLGMIAQRTQAAEMKLTAGVVAISTFIEFFTTTAAFWILFRVCACCALICQLTLVQNSELLRLGSAITMGIASCGRTIREWKPQATRSTRTEWKVEDSS
ncbi:putative signaling protein [Phytophthora cinnamomi]|uniref:putative signaling protein n=1 Tax=Phytophthora cinnamomi TaxID=4785 RepID=UPI00355A183A|nr:putative signaling protein [Phytophthora cinnamomi]